MTVRELASYGHELPVTDALELELRQLSGVACVTFGERDGAPLVELLVGNDVDLEKLNEEVLRRIANHLDGPVEVSIITKPDRTLDASGSMRVKLVVVLASEGSEHVELHLARAHKRAVGTSDPADPVSIALATIDGLRQLGLTVPFEVVAVHELDHDLGGGVLVVIKDEIDGELRRGVASAAKLPEAVAKAVLAALNRYLQA